MTFGIGMGIVIFLVGLGVGWFLFPCPQVVKDWWDKILGK